MSTPHAAPSPDPRPGPPRDTGPGFDERLWFGPVGWVGVLIAAVSLGAVLVPVDLQLGLLVGVVSLVGLVGLAVRATTRVQVVGGELVAGAAQVPIGLLAAPRTLDRAALRVELGPAMDARAFGCLRSWVPTAVRVDLCDPDDPTPYWIVSSRRPAALVDALLAAGAAAT